MRLPVSPRGGPSTCEWGHPCLRTVDDTGTLTDERITYHHPDLLGSVTAISDADGLVETRQYAPFGLPEGSSSSALAEQGFTGHRHEDGLGLIDMKGRFYDPLIGRFLSPDPLIQAPFFSQNQNGYSYVVNNPVNLVDPSGFTYGAPIPAGGSGGACDLSKQSVCGGGGASSGEPTAGRTSIGPIEAFTGMPLDPPRTSSPSTPPQPAGQGEILDLTHLPPMQGTSFGGTSGGGGGSEGGGLSPGIGGVGPGSAGGRRASGPGAGGGAPSTGGARRHIAQSASEPDNRPRILPGMECPAEACVEVHPVGLVLLTAAAAQEAVGGAAAAVQTAIRWLRMQGSELAEAASTSKSTKATMASPRAAERAVARGQGPRGITRIDPPNPRIPGSQWEAHTGGRGSPALKLDGTWKHGEGTLSREALEWLQGHGWKIP